MRENHAQWRQFGLHCTLGPLFHSLCTVTELHVSMKSTPYRSPDKYPFSAQLQVHTHLTDSPVLNQFVAAIMWRCTWGSPSRCPEPGCPLLETEITLEGKSRSADVEEEINWWKHGGEKIEREWAEGDSGETREYRCLLYGVLLFFFCLTVFYAVSDLVFCAPWNSLYLPENLVMTELW